MRDLYPTNWELSGARAASVVRYLIERGVPADRLRLSGYADRVPAGFTYYQRRAGITDADVQAANATTEQKNVNRRVEITFLQVG